MKIVYSSLQSKTARKVLRILADSHQGGLANGDISEAVHLPRSTVSECIAALGRIGLVSRSTTTDGKVGYFIEDREQLLQLLSVFEKNLLSVATDNFVDLWDL